MGLFGSLLVTFTELAGEEPPRTRKRMLPQKDSARTFAATEGGNAALISSARSAREVLLVVLTLRTVIRVEVTPSIMRLKLASLLRIPCLMLPAFGMVAPVRSMSTTLL